MKYVCEACNKVFETREEAEACEKIHEQEKAVKVAAKEEEKALSEALSAFIVKHKEYPRIELTSEARNVLAQGSVSRIIDFLCEML